MNSWQICCITCLRKYIKTLFITWEQLKWTQRATLKVVLFYFLLLCLYWRWPQSEKGCIYTPHEKWETVFLRSRLLPFPNSSALKTRSRPRYLLTNSEDRVVRKCEWTGSHLLVCIAILSESSWARTCAEALLKYLTGQTEMSSPPGLPLPELGVGSARAVLRWPQLGWKTRSVAQKFTRWCTNPQIVSLKTAVYL